MDKTFLQEAFQAMNLLEEESFNLGDITNVKELSDFMNMEEEDPELMVTDPDAESEEELKDTYIGSVILECEVCHSPIFKAVEDIVVDEDSDLANIEDECPICHSQDGFKIIGQVAPFQEEPEIKVEVEDKPEVDSDIDAEVEDDLGLDADAEEKPAEVKESLDEELDPELEDKLEEIADTVAEVAETVEEVAAEVCPECEDSEAEEIVDIEEPVEDADDEEPVEEGLLGAIGGAALGGGVLGGGLAGGIAGAAAGSIAQDALTNESCEQKLDESKMSLYDAVTNDLYGFTSSTRTVIPDEAAGEETYSENEIVPGESFSDIRVLANTPEKLAFAKKVAEGHGVENTGIQEFEPGSRKAGSRQYKYYIDITIPEDELESEVELDKKDQALRDAEAKRNAKKAEAEQVTDESVVSDKLARAAKKFAGKGIKEGFEKVDLEMEDKIIHVSEEEKEPIPDAEMITPVSDELESEIMNPENNEEPIEDTPVEEVPELDDEEPIESEEAAEDETVDYDVDDFEEEDFDDLGESYLKKVYENVESFKTTAVKSNENSLIVEGNIKFKSGKEKATQFIFEASEATKDGKVKFIGENAQITRGKKAFTLAGSINEGKFIAESLNYNYRTNNNRVYGTIKKD